MNLMSRALLHNDTLRQGLDGFGRTPRGASLLRRLDHEHAIYPSFAEAWRAAAQDRHAGHEHPQAIRTHLDLARTLRPSDYAALFWLSRIDGDLHVFDFGGNVGNLYYSYRPYLLATGRALQWTVHDLPAIVDAGRVLAAQREEARLRFAEDFEALRGCNLLLASGALHYWEEPLDAFFARLPERPPNILVNRTPVHDREDDFITVQRCEHYAVPCIVRNSDGLIDAFARAGYRLVDRWKALELSLDLPLFPRRSVPWYQGFYFQRG